MAHTGPSPYQFDKWICHVFIYINIKYCLILLTFTATRLSHDQLWTSRGDSVTKLFNGVGSLSPAKLLVGFE